MKIRQCENKSKENFNRISKQISNHVFFLSKNQKLSKNNNFLNQSDRNVGYLQNYEREHLENWQQRYENKQWPEMYSSEGSFMYNTSICWCIPTKWTQSIPTYIFFFRSFNYNAFPIFLLNPQEFVKQNYFLWLVWWIFNEYQTNSSFNPRLTVAKENLICIFSPSQMIFHMNSGNLQ